MPDRTTDQPSEHGDDRHEAEPSEDQRPADADASSAPESPPETPSLGSSLRRFARAAGEVADAGLHEASRQARRAADAARPEAERLAKQAKAALDASRPHVERAAGQARDYVVEHEEELKRAAGRGARVAADAATPRILRPAVKAAEEELRKPQNAPEDETAEDDRGGDDAASDAPAP
jgi:hypothetical protein